MKTTILILAAVVAAPAAAQPARAAPESISYQTSPCFGRCPVYTVTVYSNGRAIFEGVRFTTVTGTRNFRITPRQYLAFRRHLAPLHPASGSVRYAGRDRCESMATDLPSAEVTWRGPRGEQQLHFYYGCDMQKNRAIADRLRRAPGLLPVSAYIGTSR